MTTDDDPAEDRWLAAWVHRERLLRLACARGADPADAEDFVSEAVLRAASHHVAVASLPAWLTTVTVHLCYDSYRARARAERGAGPAPAPLADDPVCDWVAVVDALGRLPARQRTAVELRAMGHGVPDIASSLGCTYKTVESLLSRGRAALRASLGEEGQRRVV